MTAENIEFPFITEGGAFSKKLVYSTKMLTDIINEQDDQPDRARGGEEYLHASGLLNFCGRRDQLTKMTKEQGNAFPRSADRVVWAIGRACEAHIRKQIQKGIGRQKIFASWRCVCQESEVLGVWRDTICKKCSKPCNTFHEIPVWDHELKIVGNPDILLLDEGKLRVVEIKSINKKEFDLLTEAKPDHITQANIYQRMLVKEGFAVHNRSIVFYCSKDYGWQNPYKEFHIHSDDSSILLDEIFASVKAYREAMTTANELTAGNELVTGNPLTTEDGLYPRLAVCSSMNSPMAKKCSRASRCFVNE